MTRRVKAHIRLGIHSVSPSDQCSRCPHEETLGPYLPIAKFRGVSARNAAEFLRERKMTVKQKVPRKNEKKSEIMNKMNKQSKKGNDSEKTVKNIKK